MPKERKTVSFSHESKRTIKCVSAVKKCSESAAVDFIVKSFSPIANKIIYHHNEIQQIENIFLKMSIREHISEFRSEPEVTKEEYFSTVWKTHIKSPLSSTYSGFFQLKVSEGKMGKDEKIKLRDKLMSIRESYSMEKAILIYNRRTFDEKNQSIMGDASIFLIHRTSFDDYTFDAGQVQLLPTSELITFGVKEVIRRQGILLPYPVICWIDIHHVNGMSLMLPITHKSYTSSYSSPPNDIVINPFSQEG